VAHRRGGGRAAPGADPTSTASGGSSPTSTPTRTAAPGAAVPIASAEDYDPPPEGNGEEHPEEIRQAYDGDPSTMWTTMSYHNNPNLGGIKAGVGLWVDLGKVEDVGSVDVSLRGGGTDIELRAAPESAASAPTGIDGWQRVASTSADSKVTLRPQKPVRTRYLLLWLTKLPPDGGDYRGGISEIVVRR
jgi:hypothetical protein